VPSVLSISVDGASNSPTNANGPDAEVMLDIEVIGSVAPKAQIFVYFAPNTMRVSSMPSAQPSMIPSTNRP